MKTIWKKHKWKIIIAIILFVAVSGTATVIYFKNKEEKKGKNEGKKIETEVEAEQEPLDNSAPVHHDVKEQLEGKTEEKEQKGKPTKKA